MSHPDEIAMALERAREDTRDHPGPVDVELTLRLCDDDWQLTDTEITRWEPQHAA